MDTAPGEKAYPCTPGADCSAEYKAICSGGSVFDGLGRLLDPQYLYFRIAPRVYRPQLFLQSHLVCGQCAVRFCWRFYGLVWCILLAGKSQRQGAFHPADLDYEIANKFVAFAMENVAMDSNDIQRYVVFSVGKYCIAGTACITSNIALAGDEEYIRDKFGRKIQAFIGIAVDKSGNHTDIPMLSNEKYREIYLKYLKINTT